MKKMYETLEMEVTEFEVEDIITQSGHDLENSDLYGDTESGTGEGGGEF